MVEKRNCWYYLRVLPFLLMGFYCFGQAEVQDTTVVYDERFDPFSLHDEEEYFFEAFSIEEILRKINSESYLRDSFRDSLDLTRVEGYRVQLLSTPDYREAEELYRRVSTIFKTKVYLVFDAPNYKIRVGDFRKREEAQEFQRLAIKRGFTHAWIVRSQIREESGNESLR